MVPMAAAVLPTGHREKFKDNHEVDLAYSVAGLGRFRCNCFQQRGTIGMIFRVIPMRVVDDRRPGAAEGPEEDRRRRARPGRSSPARRAAARARRWRR